MVMLYLKNELMSWPGLLHADSDATIFGQTANRFFRNGSKDFSDFFSGFLAQNQTLPYLVGWLVGNAVFSETALRIFLIFCIKLGDYKGRKVTEAEVRLIIFCCQRKHNPTNIYLFKVNNRNTRKSCETCSRLTIKTQERRQ